MPQLLNSAQSGRPIDVLGLNMAYGLDYVSAFIFGLPRGTNFIEDVGARDVWLARYLKSHPNQYMFWLLDAPKIRIWLSKLRIHVVPSWVWKAREDLDQWALRIVNQTEKAMSEVAADDMKDGDFPVVYHQLKTSMVKEDRQLGQTLHAKTPWERPSQLASECLDHLGIPLCFRYNCAIEEADITVQLPRVMYSVRFLDIHRG